MTTKQLREQMFQDMQDLRDNKIDLKTARAITKTAAQIVYSKRLDIEEANLNYKVAKSTAKSAKVLPTKL